LITRAFAPTQFNYGRINLFHNSVNGVRMRVGVVVPGQFYEKAMQAQAHRTIRSGVYCGPGRKTHVASECLRFVRAYKLFGDGNITVHCLRSGDAKL
jgi:hypothetical protein